MISRFASAVLLFAVASWAAEEGDVAPAEDAAPENKGEFTILKADGKLPAKKKDPIAEMFGLRGEHQTYIGTWGGTMFRLMLTIESPVALTDQWWY